MINWRGSRHKVNGHVERKFFFFDPSLISIDFHQTRFSYPLYKAAWLRGLHSERCLDLGPIDLLCANPLLSGHDEDPGMSAISIVVADQQKTLRSSYTKQLLPEAGIAVIGQAATSYEVIKSLKLKPHVLLLDWEISSIRGVSILPLVRHQSPGTMVILIGEQDLSAAPG